MARNVILLKNQPQCSIEENDVADEAIIPGHLLKITATGVAKNTANADDVVRRVALERDELGKGIDTAYAIGDCVKTATLVPGNHAYLFLASGQNAAKGDYLTGDNAGLLTKTGVADGVRLFQALESVDTSGSAPVAGTRIRVEAV